MQTQVKSWGNSQGIRHKTLEERAAEYGGELGLDGEFNWGEAVGREQEVYYEHR